jgi:trigger factor
MQTTLKKLSPASAELTVEADENTLADIKRAVFNQLRGQVKADGFRAGKAPDAVVESSLGSQQVQGEFLNEALGRLYALAVSREQLQTIGSPEVSLKKFVPYSELEFTATVEVMPEIKLTDYKKFKVPLKTEKPTEAQIDEVLQRMRRRLAETKPADRAAAEGDEVRIDFAGIDARGQPVPGAQSQDFPVTIGSKTFVPGFEDELIGLKAEQKKTFTLTFPKDYQVASLQGAKVTFAVTVREVREVKLPELDDAFVAKASPFKTVAQLRSDVSGQLERELTEEARRRQREELVGKLVEGSKLTLPPKLLGRVLDDLRAEFRRNLDNRGLSEADFYSANKTTAEKYEKSELMPAAERRVKASLLLSEVARKESLSLSRDELEQGVADLQERYKDNPQVLADLDKPEVREDIAMQILTERTIDKLVSYASPS